MKNQNTPLDRLMRSAATPAGAGEVPAVAWSLEQRVLAALRSHRQVEDLSWLAPLLRRAFTAAGALTLVVGFLAFHSPTESVAGTGPTHELAVMDQELALALVPTARQP